MIGPQSYHRLPELIAKAHRSSGEALATDFTPREKFDTLPSARSVTGPTAFLTVQEGCDKFCTFCVVPYTRGAEFSRPAGAIEAEARALVLGGVREVTLLGQNVNAWNDGQDGGLAGLISRLARISGLERIRYTTSHPADMDDALIAAHADIPKLMPWIHLPVQSGSDRILAAMNRSHSVASYVATIHKLRAARDDIGVSGDFIVGFPGETEADFEATLELVREVGYAQAFSFKYSRRPGTPAAALPRQIPEAVKHERLSHLQSLLTQQQTAFNQASVGHRLPILFERDGRLAGQIVGKSPHLQAVHCDGPESRVGQVAMVDIKEALSHSLAGILAKDLH